MTNAIQLPVFFHQVIGWQVVFIIAGVKCRIRLMRRGVTDTVDIVVEPFAHVNPIFFFLLVDWSDLVFCFVEIDL